MDIYYKNYLIFLRFIFVVDEDWWIEYNMTELVTGDNILQKNKNKNLLQNIQVLCALFVA